MKIAVCVPAGGGMCRIETAATLFGMASYQSEHKLAFIHASACDVPYNRNRMVETGLEFGADAFMWVDADVTCSMNGALVRLASHNVSIVGASYRRGEPPYEMLGQLNGSEFKGLLGMDFLPGGFVLVRRQVYDAIEPPWYSEGYIEYPKFATDDVWFAARVRDEGGFIMWLDPIVTDAVSHHKNTGLKSDASAIPARPEADDDA